SRAGPRGGSDSAENPSPEAVTKMPLDISADPFCSSIQAGSWPRPPGRTRAWSFSGDPMSSVDPILAVLREAARLLSDGVIVTTAARAQPQIVHVNEAMCRIAGYRADELVGNTPRLLQGQKTNRGVLATLRSALEVHHQFFGEVVNYRKDGSEYPV